MPQRDGSATTSADATACTDGDSMSGGAMAERAALADRKPLTFALTERSIAMIATPNKIVPFIALVAFGIALVAAVLFRGLVARAMLPIVIGGVAIVMLVRRRMSRPVTNPAEPRRSVEFDGKRFTLVWRSGIPGTASAQAVGRRLLGESGERFGLTLLSNRRRDRVVAAVTSPSGCFLLGSDIDDSQRRVNAQLLSRANVLANGEVALDAIGPDGLPLELGSDDFRSFVDAMESEDPQCTNRMLLSDPSGAPLRLEGEELEVRGRRFDLSRPLEWRGIFFQETFGQSLALYQGTYIRQGLEEVVLVSLLPPSVLDPQPLDFEGTGSPELDLAAMRDQRLMQASAGEPPPTEQRVAVDGLFMLPLRVALDQAPRNSQQPADLRHA